MCCSEFCLVVSGRTSSPSIMGAVWDAPPFLVLSPTVSGRRPLPIHDRILIRFFRNMPVFSVFFLLPNVANQRRGIPRTLDLSCWTICFIVESTDLTALTTTNNAPLERATRLLLQTFFPVTSAFVSCFTTCVMLYSCLYCMETKLHFKTSYKFAKERLRYIDSLLFIFIAQLRAIGNYRH
jgi:hypothetical protein